MLMFAIAVVPLIQALVNREKWDQNWYADDSACAAKLPRLCKWFERLVKMGPDFGYYPNPQKSIVVVDSKDEAEAHQFFDELGVTVATGQHFLGSFIGNQEGTQKYVKQKVVIWTCCVEKNSPKQQNHSHRQLMRRSQNPFSLSGPICSG